MADALGFGGFAGEIERTGAGFYRAAAARAANRRIKEVLEFLAQEEDTHAKDMETLASENWSRAVLQRAFRKASETLPFLSQSPEDAGALAVALDTTEAALRFATEMEKTSIAFYEALLAEIDDARIAEQIREVARQEKEHGRRLAELLELESKCAAAPYACSEEAERELTEAVRSDESAAKKNSGN